MLGGGAFAALAVPPILGSGGSVPARLLFVGLGTILAVIGLWWRRTKGLAA
jgi:hypothetical protein